MFDLKGGMDLYKRIALMFLVVSVLATACLTVFVGTAAADVVVNAAGSPIEGALVKLVDYPQYNDTTDVNGNYIINSVPYGTYTISASADGYHTNTSTVVVDGTTINKDFILSYGSLLGMLQISSDDVTSTLTSTIGIPLPRHMDAGTSFMGQFDNRRATAGWYTLLYVSDVTGSGATLTIDYLHENNGSLHNSEVQVVPANGVYTITTETSTTLDIGKISVTSDNPVVIEKRIVGYNPATWDVNSAMSTLMTKPSDTGTSFMGQFDNRRSTAGWYTAVLVSDVTGSGATLTIDYLYDTNGTLYNSEVQLVPANGAYTITPESSTTLGMGTISVTSTSNVAMETRIVGFTPGTWESKAIMAVPMSRVVDASTELVVPRFINTRLTDGWYTAILVSDVTGSGATLTIDYLYENGTVHTSEVQSVSANGTYVVTPESSTTLSEGKILIHSDAPVLGEMRTVSFEPGTWVMQGIMSVPVQFVGDTAGELIIPQYDSTDVWDSLASISSGGAVSVILDYYSNAGALQYNEVQPINANGTHIFYPGNVSEGRPEFGRVVITQV